MALDEYEAFVAVVEQGSISAAARVLGVPRPTVSRRLTRLEERLGERLVVRGRESVPTRVGRELLERVAGPMAQIGAAEQALQEQASTPSGLLRVALSPQMALALAPMLPSFRERYPAVRLDLRTEGRFVDLTAGGFDVALRGGVLRQPDLVQRRLFTLRAGLYAHPDYVARNGQPRGPEELSSHRLLRAHGARGEPRTRWPLRTGGSIGVDGAFTTDDRTLLRAAVMQGLGIGLLTHLPVLPPELVPVCPAVGAEVGVFVVYPDRELLPPRTRAFVDAVVAWFGPSYDGSAQEPGAC